MPTLIFFIRRRGHSVSWERSLKLTQSCSNIFNIAVFHLPERKYTPLAYLPHPRSPQLHTFNSSLRSYYHLIQPGFDRTSAEPSALPQKVLTNLDYLLPFREHGHSHRRILISP
jgi:hypothetical protein